MTSEGEFTPHVAPEPAVAPASQEPAAASGVASAAQHVSRETFVREATPAPAPAPASEPERYRVHHSYVWLSSIYIVVAVVIALLFSAGPSLIPLFLSGDMNFALTLAVGGGVLFLSLAIIAIAVVLQVLSYKYLYYMIEPDEFSVHSGVISKKHVHVPYQRIQSVNQKASLLQRVFGVCSLTIETAGGSENKAISVPYVTKQQAESLRAELFARKYLSTQAAHAAASRVAASPGQAVAPSAALQGQNVSRETSVRENVLDVPAEIWDELGGVFANQGGAFVVEEPVSYECGLSNKELVLTGVSNSSAFVIILLGIFAAVLQLISMGFGMMTPAVEGMAEALIAEYAQFMIMISAVSMVGVAVVAWIFSVLMTCVSYGGFRARRRGTRIEVERGLLQHRFQGVEIDRIQSVVIKQSLIRRWMGYCELSLSIIDALSEGESNKQGFSTEGGVVIHPFVKVSRVNEILGGFLPEFSDVPREAIPVAPVALRRGLIRSCVVRSLGFWLAVCALLAQVILHVSYGADVAMGSASAKETLAYVDMFAVAVYLFAVFIIVVEAVDAVFWARESSFAVNTRFLQMNIGGLSRRTICLPRNKIQFGYARVNPFQRRAHTATLSVRTAAGIGGTTTNLIDVREEDADAWLAWLRPYCAATSLTAPVPAPAAAPAPAPVTVAPFDQNVSRETFVRNDSTVPASTSAISDSAPDLEKERA